MEKIVKHNGWLKIYQIDDETRNGVPFSREVMSRQSGKKSDDAVAGLLYDTEKEVYYFVEQYRAGAAIRGEDPYIIETVAGTLEIEEDPQECFIREAMEEVGFEVSQIQSFGSFYTSPGGTSEKMYLYTAFGTRTEEGGGLESENEDIKVISVTEDELSTFKTEDLKTQYLLNLIKK